MFARSASTRRTWTPLRLLVVGLSLVMAATFGPPAATAGDPGSSGDAPYRGRVISLMQHMTLQQKVGQLFVIEVAGRHATAVSDAAKAVNQRLYGVDTPAQAIAKYQPGGVIYYSTRTACAGCTSDDNIGDPAQVATLSNGLQAASLAQPAHIPLQISVDQEGGALVARFLPPATQMPGNMALGAGRSAADAHESAEVIGEELEAVGVTQDYAPVADVNINPNNPVIGIRSIGGDVDLVSDLASAQVKGYHAGGVSAVAKHFPGHGDTGVDSHFGLPQVTHSLEQFHAIDLPPFKAAIAAGVDTIMTAHVVFPAVDPTRRAGHDEPRDPHRRAARRARLQGPDRHRRARHGGRDRDLPAGRGPRGGDPRRRRPAPGRTADGHGVRRRARRGQGRHDQQEAARRVGLPRPAAQVPARHLRRRRWSTRRRRRRSWARPSTWPGRRRSPTTPPRWSRTTPGCCRWPPAPARCSSQAGVSAPPRGSRTRWPRGARRRRSWSPALTPTATKISDAVAAAQDSDLVVVSTNNAYAISAATGQPTAAAVAQTQLVRALLATGKPVVVAAMRNPYDVASFPEAPTVLDTYGYTTHQVESLVRVLFGEVNPTGRLPVSIPRADGTGELFPFGHGLRY